MSDVKNTITLFCQCVELSTGLEIKPEYFKIARQNIVSIEAVSFLYLVFILILIIFNKKRIFFRIID